MEIDEAFEDLDAFKSSSSVDRQEEGLNQRKALGKIEQNVKDIRSLRNKQNVDTNLKKEQTRKRKQREFQEKQKSLEEDDSEDNDYQEDLMILDEEEEVETPVGVRGSSLQKRPPPPP